MIITLRDGGTLDVARWPLPAGTDDSLTLNRSQLAVAFGVSENTITKWIGDGMPVEVEGGNGVAYEFRLSHCHAWKMERNENARAKVAQADAVARQFALAFLNSGEDEPERHGLTPAEIRAWAEAEHFRNKVAEQRGDLIRVSVVRDAVDDMFGAIRRFFENLPDWAEAEFGMKAEEVARLQARCDQTMVEIRTAIEAQVMRPGQVVTLAAPEQQALPL